MAKIQIKELKPQVATLQIKHPITEDIEFDLPDGTKGPLELYVIGRNSQAWMNFMKKMKSTGASKEELFSRISDEAHEFVASLITGWKDNGAIDEVYSQEAALSLISNPENIWLLEQLQAFLLDEANFFLKTLTN